MLFSITLFSLLAACGLKRNLELPDGKHKDQPASQAGQTTPAPAPVPTPAPKN